MSGDIVNLRRARKAKHKAAEAAAAAENRLIFGESKDARARAAKSESLEKRRFEGHLRDTREIGASPTLPDDAGG